MNGLSVSTLRHRTPRRSSPASPGARRNSPFSPPIGLDLPLRTHLGLPAPRAPHVLRPPDLDAYAAAGGPVDRNNPLTTFVVAGSRITIDRSAIGLLQCGHAQPFTSNTRFSSSAQQRRSSARAVVSRLSSASTRLSAARGTR